MEDRAAQRLAAPFQLGDWQVVPGLNRIERQDASSALEPRAMDLLLCLARRAGETVSKETILEEVWGGAFVVEGVIPKTISALRTALGDDATRPSYILTVARRGYRLVAPVSAAPVQGAERGAPVPDLPALASPRPAVNWRRVSAWLSAALVALVSLAWFARARQDSPAPAASPGQAELPDSIQNLLLEARLLWSKRGLDSVARANDLLLEAVKEAPGSAEVQGWLALSFLTRGNYLGAYDRMLPLAAEHTARALELDERSAIAHCAAGVLAISRDFDPGTAIARQRRAIELDPNLVAAHQFLAEALAISGQHPESIAAIAQAIRLEPLSAVLHGVRGLVLQHADRPLAALEAYDRVLVLEPGFGWVHQNRAYVLFRLGRGAEASASILKAVESRREREEHLATLRAELEEKGLPGYWSWTLNRLDAVGRDGVRARPVHLAEALAGSGRLDEAMVELENARRFPDGELFFHMRNSPAFDALRDRPEYLELYARAPGK